MSYTEKDQTTRTTIYRVTDTADNVISYYRKEFLDAGWIMERDGTNNFTVSYASRSDQPPFIGGIAITSIDGSVVEYRVPIAINGPFQWADYCPNLKP